MTEDERKRQFDNLACVLRDMKEYLYRLEQGCTTLPMGFHSNNKDYLEKLLQIMEGMGYYQKLLKSASTLLGIDPAEKLCGDTTIETFIADLYHTFDGICQAAESEDYSLATDLVEYDLVPAIQTAQLLLSAVQGRYAERVI